MYYKISAEKDTYTIPETSLLFLSLSFALFGREIDLLVS